MAPMVTNGTNDDPLATMTVHWSYNGDNDTNGDNGAISTIGDIGINESNGANGSPMSSLVPLTQMV